MQYKSANELPRRVRGNLPDGAQEIYVNTYNSASEEYRNPEKRRGIRPLEETAAKVMWSALNAWSAVKKEYDKLPDGTWYIKN